MDTIILHGNVLTPNGILEDGAVLMSSGKITAIAPSVGLEMTPGAEVTDAGGLFVSPGFIDAHTHGGKGFDFMTCTATELDEVLAWLASCGVTAVLPTLASSPFDLELEMAQHLGTAVHRASPGAAIVGLHLEGPYINPEKRGAQPVGPIRLPDLEEMRALIEASGHTVRLVTLAPELPGALDLVRYLVRMGIVASAGHSNATYQEMLVGIQAGITRVAHLYNGMSPFNHREPGVTGAALEQDGVFAELVMDGIHVHPAAGRIAIRSKGLDRVVLISDATQAAGLGDGIYTRPGNRKIIVKDGEARLESGSLAGSTLTMDRAVANAEAFLGLSLDHAIQLASWNAANSLNLPGRGCLASGYLADVIILDREVHIQATFVSGLKVYQA
jgi:N-acetylglucosamine-6-phosphate deacetylase